MSTLNKNDDWTELDEQFKDLMQEMMEESSNFYDEPKNQVDYSFLHKSSIGDKDDNETRLNIDVVKYRKKFSSFASRIAIFALCILVAGSGIAIWINSQQASALKFQAEKKLYEVEDGTFSIDTAKQKSDQADENYITRKYKSMEDINKAKEFMPKLPIPEYIPEGYELDVLKIDKAINDTYVAFYDFKNDNKHIYINILDTNEDSSYNMEAEGKIVDVKGKQVCIWEDKATDCYGYSFILNDMTISITGQISENEMLEMVEKII